MIVSYGFSTISSLFMFLRSGNLLLTELICLDDLQTSRSIKRFSEVLMIVPYAIYGFEVKESIADIPTELPCLGDLENPGQLPVQ